MTDAYSALNTFPFMREKDTNAAFSYLFVNVMVVGTRPFNFAKKGVSSHEK